MYNCRLIKKILCLISIFMALPGGATNFTPANLAALIADINTANTNGQADTISLSSILPAVNLIAGPYSANGANGLPSILADGGNLLTFQNGTIQRVAGSPSFRLFHIAAGANVLFNNVTLRNGLTVSPNFGGAIYNLGTLDIRASIIEDNQVLGNGSANSAHGGAIYNLGTFVVRTTTFEDNQALGTNGLLAASTARGGAIYHAAGSLNVLSTTIFNSNEAIGGTALVALLSPAGSGYGGAIYATTPGTVVDINGTYTSNEALGGNGLVAGVISLLGGAAGEASGGAVFITGITGTTLNGTYTNNLARGGNAAAAVLGSFDSGQAYGGAISLNTSTFSQLSTSILSGNIARGGAAAVGGLNGESAANARGGAIYLNDSSITTLNTNTFDSNLAIGGLGLASVLGTNGGYGRGGAIYVNSTAASANLNTIRDSTLSNNQSVAGAFALVILGDETTGSHGGAIYLNAATIASTVGIFNSTLSGNHADGHGGGIDIFGAASTVNMTNSTVTDNEATYVIGGGGIYLHSTATINNFISNIVAANSDGGSADGQDLVDLAPPTITTATNNLIGVGGGSSITNGVSGNIVGTIATPTSPGLLPLTNNGGTTLTHALSPTSLALDVGLNPSAFLYDQRGANNFRAVPTGSPDIGAYELQCTDTDGDGVCDDVDNCPLVDNPVVNDGIAGCFAVDEQPDADCDTIGDACDLCPNNSANNCSPGDLDNDGILDENDNCPTVPNALQEDGDLDGIGTACDYCPTDITNSCDPGDVDEDGIQNDDDNCIAKYNPLQEDEDNDGMGDVCDYCPSDALNLCDPGDIDNDDVQNSLDNCMTVANPVVDDAEAGCLVGPEQPDADCDGIGDPCDVCPADATNTCAIDSDLDGVPNTVDNCLAVDNPVVNDGPSGCFLGAEQPDTDCDGIGNACDICPTDNTNSCNPGDIDGDGFPNTTDNCPAKFTLDQGDSDGDGMGNPCDLCPNDANNACDPGDADGDGVQNGTDNCVAVDNPLQTDTDLDGIGDACDFCPNDATNTCATDTDGDGDLNVVDNCIAKANPLQEDADLDGMGDACDPCPNDLSNTCTTDSDLDGVPNTVDNCLAVDNPLVDDGDAGCIAGAEQPDADCDGIGDPCDVCPNDNTNTCTTPDNDFDNDGVTDDVDSCPIFANPLVDDGDAGCISGAEQPDADCDGIGDPCDVCPNDISNTCVIDSDLDGVANDVDNCLAKDNPLVDDGDEGCVIGPEQPDADCDGMGDPCDTCPNDASNTCATDSDLDGVPNTVDNCLAVDNPLVDDGDAGCIAGAEQPDADCDGIGDPCDVCPNDNTNTCTTPDNDFDNDGVTDDVDSCPIFANPLVDDGDAGCISGAEQPDADCDGIGDPCDVCPTDATNTCVIDSDLDGVANDVDNCLAKDNPLVDDGDEGCVIGPEQPDADCDGMGDPCDTCPNDASNTCATDSDLDGVPNTVDNCLAVDNPLVDDGDAGCIAGAEQPDADCDGIGDPCDVCPNDNTNTCTTPDNDFDNDGVTDDVDSCPIFANPLVDDGDAGCISGAEQPDADCDGIGDPCDVCPTDATNTCVIDSDLDGVANDVDNCLAKDNPLVDDGDEGCVIGPEQPDADCDGMGDPCDTCPNDPSNTCATDSDLDGVPNTVDNCLAVDNPLVDDGDAGCIAGAEQPDADCDGIGDPCDVCVNDNTNTCTTPDNDFDNDGVTDDVDSCPIFANPLVDDGDAGCIAGAEQPDADCDGIGDPCDVCPTDASNTCAIDSDLDGVLNTVDNCLAVDNPLVDDGPLGCLPGAEQPDTDCDGIGDPCDICPTDSTNSCNPGDVDGDGVPNTTDNCQAKANVDQGDSDGDGMGNPCDLCPNDANNACDPGDADGDGVQNVADNCIAVDNPLVNDGPLGCFPGAEQPDTDCDGIGNPCDVCPTDATNTCIVADDDFDNDGVLDNVDNCPIAANPIVNDGLLGCLPGAEQPDADCDGIGNACDTCPSDATNTCAIDSDLDGVLNVVDNCLAVDNPLVDDGPLGCFPGAEQPDTDCDGIGNPCDVCPTDATNTCITSDDDFDDDGVLDDVDNCPVFANPNVNDGALGCFPGAEQPDTDCDGIGNACDICPTDNTNNCNAGDVDGDNVQNNIDNCLAVDNPIVNDGPLGCFPGAEQPDTDCDGIGNACDNCPNDATNTCLVLDSELDLDLDNDTILDAVDNCVEVPNVAQTDTDLDGIGNACDYCPSDATNTCAIDSDGDGDLNNADNCLAVPNANQADTDLDGIGNVCDPCPADATNTCATDTDGDGDLNVADNCIALPNANQADTDLDGIGNVCDPCPADATNTCATDTDGDGDLNVADNCLAVPNANQADTDLDGIGNACDLCPNDATNTCFVLDSELDLDLDNDTILDALDNCVEVPNVGQTDTDLDGIGNACDYCPTDATNTCAIDTDGDGDLNNVDNCIIVANPTQANSDQDALGDACDPCPNDATNACVLAGPGSNDADGDGVINGVDNCPFVANPIPDDEDAQIDTDADGLGDECDRCPRDSDATAPGSDPDSDEVCTFNDNCPADSNPLQEDLDQDGNGDACDACPDQDGDGDCDAVDNCILAPNPTQADTDQDGIGNACDLCPVDDVGGDDTDNDGVCNAADRCQGSNDAVDTDKDAIPDGCDNCLEDANQNQRDTDQDNIGDACDLCTDRDDDGVGDEGFNNSECEVQDIDNCPLISNPTQDDFDGDGLGDRCDTIPGGATVISTGTVPVPPPVIIAPPVGAAGIGGVPPVLDKAPTANIAVADKAPSPEVSVNQGRAVRPAYEDITKDSNEDVESEGGCSTTGNTSASTLALWFMVLLLLKNSPRLRARNN